MEILDTIRGLIRPYIAVTGWTAFLVVVIMAIRDYLNEEIALSLIAAFGAAVTTIVGVWIGGRAVKKGE